MLCIRGLLSLSAWTGFSQGCVSWLQKHEHKLDKDANIPFSKVTPLTGFCTLCFTRVVSLGGWIEFSRGCIEHKQYRWTDHTEATCPDPFHLAVQTSTLFKPTKSRITCIPGLSSLIRLRGGFLVCTAFRWANTLGTACGFSFFSPVFSKIAGSNWSTVKWSCKNDGSSFISAQNFKWSMVPYILIITSTSENGRFYRYASIKNIQHPVKV